MCSSQAVLASLEPHLAIQSLYGPPEPAGAREKPADSDRAARPVEAEATPKARPVYITFDSEYLDTSIPTEVGSNMKLVTENLRPR